jgi:hypothetical protein
MQAWRGWTAATVGAPTTAPLTWAEWRARQHRALRDEQRRRRGVPFNESELARLSFMRWLYQTGHVDLQERDTV